MKKFFKIIFTGILSIALLGGALYGGFHLWEYATGGKYIAYLQAHSETLPLDQSFGFDKLDQDIQHNRLVLVGEIHGFGEPQKFDYDLFTHLHAKHQVKHYFAELDFVQATLLNQYMRSGDESLLNEALQKWAVVQGRNNKGYYDKYRKFQAYYQTLPEGERFEFIGVDAVQDIGLTARFLNALLPASTDTSEVSTDIESLLGQIRTLDSVYAHAADTLFLLSHIQTNLQYLSARENREKVLFENFHALFSQQCSADDKAYGFFGLFHVFQYQVSGQQPLAARLRTSDLGFENKILSINVMMVESYMVKASNELPEFMRDPGAYMNADSSPYANSSRMSKTIQLLPVAERFEFEEKGKPYVQYTLFVRNSDWAEPAM